MRGLAGLVALLLWISPALAETYPDHTEATVYDFADVLSAAQERELEALNVELRDTYGPSLVIVTMSSMRDYGWSGEIEPYATNLFNRWGIGDAARNDGVLMLVAINDRKARIELGRGFSTLWNRQMRQIMDDDMLPAFRTGAYELGIITGAASIRDAVQDFSAPVDAGPLARGWRSILLFFTAPLSQIGAIVSGAIGIPLFYVRRQRRKPRRCPRDGTKMVLLDEDWDDNELQKGQQAEERLGSVDYDVWQCQSCGDVTIEAYKSWFSRYGACRECGFRTVQGTEHVTQQPTYSSTGLANVDYHCLNCDARYSVTRTIPMKTRSSSSSGGSSSSFGGGSSSGGGASGSW